MSFSACGSIAIKSREFKNKRLLFLFVFVKFSFNLCCFRHNGVVAVFENQELFDA